MATETGSAGDLTAQIEQARRAGRRAKQRELRAVRAEVVDGHLHVWLHNGVSISLPVTLLGEVDGAGPAALAQVEVPPSGYGVHWPRLDVHVALSGILEAALGDALGEQWASRPLVRRERRG